MKKTSMLTSQVRVFMLVLSLMFAGGNLQAEVTSGKCGDNLNWSYDSDTKTLTFSGYGDMTDYSSSNPSWPSDVKFVTSACEAEFSISNFAFDECSSLTTVSLPNATSIGVWSFYGCSSLTTVSLPNATSIGSEAFVDCSKLTTVVLGAPCSIDVSAFGKVLDTLIMLAEQPQDYIADEETGGIEYDNFYYPKGKESNYTVWIESAYDKRIPLTYHESSTVTCLDVHKTAGWYTDDNSIFVTDNYEVKPVGDNVAKGIGHDFSSEYTVDVPATCTTAGSQSRHCTRTGCTETTDVTMIAALGHDWSEWQEGDDGIALRTCKNDASHTEKATGNCGENLTWAYSVSNASLTISGSGKMDNYGGNSPWFELPFTKVVFEKNGDEGISVGEFAFYISDETKYNVTTIVGSEGVSAVGDNAFDGCALTTVSLPNATSIGSSAFDKCSSLTTVSLPKATTIGDYAFYVCSSLTSADLPNASSIGNYAFSDCSSLTSADLPKASSIGVEAFRNCDKLATVSLPKATSIGDYAFVNCDKLASVSLPKATTIGDHAFYALHNLTSVSLPNADTIGTGAFEHCVNLHTVLIGGGDKGYWGNDVFSICSNLKHLVVLNTAAPTISTLGASGFTLYYLASLAESYTNWSDVGRRVALTYHEADEATYKVNGWYSEDNSIYVTDDYKLVITHKYTTNGFCSNCGGYEPATDTDKDGVYEIANAGQLYWFASLVNDSTDGNTANAVLTDNIVVNDTANWTLWDGSTTGLRSWTPIGNGSTPYAGTFNGQGYAISGLYCSLFSDNVGLFGAISKATVANVGLEKSYIHSSNGFVGGICGHCEGTINGDNLEGGIVNCYNTGKVDGTVAIGGICGRSDNAKLANCFSTGSVTGSNSIGAICGSYGNTNAVSTNCYYLNGTDVSETATSKSADQFASGEVAILLQKYVDESGDATLADWMQVIGDANPTFGKGGIQYMREKKSNNWGTLCVPYAISETNATFYTVDKMDGDVLVLKALESEGKVDAGVPVIYYCAEDTLMVLVQVFGDPAKTKNDGLLKGVYEQTTVEGENTYYLKNNMFYRCNGKFTVGAFKAYIQYPNPVGAPRSLNFMLNDETTTGVDEVVNDGVAEEAHIVDIFNIKGQRVANMQKGGIYILKMSDGTTQKAVVR